MRVFLTSCCKVGYYLEGQYVNHCPSCGRYNPKLVEEEKALTYFDVSEPPSYDEVKGEEE